MVANTDLKARLFDLWVSVSEMVRSGKRDAGQVAQTLQVIKDDPDFAKRFLAPPANSLRVKSKSLQAQLTQWNVLYSQEFGFSLDIFTLMKRIPKRVPGLDRLLVVAQGLTPNRIVSVLKKRMTVWQYADNLDTVQSVRKTDQAYAIWVRDRVEADEELKNQSANDLQNKGINGITLEECLLLELKYFLETGKHLDENNWTLCAGSRDPDGGVPFVSWYPVSREVRVNLSYADSANGLLRSRQVVSA